VRERPQRRLDRNRLTQITPTHNIDQRVVAQPPENMRLATGILAPYPNTNVTRHRDRFIALSARERLPIVGCEREREVNQLAALAK
jgi:hypothetical protein